MSSEWGISSSFGSNTTVVITVGSKKGKKVQSNLDCSNTDVSKYHKSKNIVWTHSLFYLHSNSCSLKLLISQSKFSGTRKFTLRYHKFVMSVDFEISIVDCMHIRIVEKIP